MAKLSEISNDNGRRESLLIHDEPDNTPHDLTYDDFISEYEREPKNLYDKLLRVHQEFYGISMEKDVKIAELELRNQEKEGELITLQRKKTEIDQLLTTLRSDKEEVDRQLADVENERDTFATQVARMMMNRTTSAQQSSPATIPSKSAKIPDPPLLTDGKEPRFEDWLLLMSQKLAANADHFDTPQLRKACVVSRCEGKARKHIIPRLRDDSMNPYTDSKDMLNHLKAIYDDPNRVTTAKHQFRQLYMKTGNKFHDFLSEFLHLAAEAGVAEEDWKDELFHKLTTELQKLCITASIQNGSFQEFSSAVSQTASRLEVINHRTQRNRSFAPSNRDTTNKGTSQSGTAVKKEPTPSQGTSPTTQRMGNAEHDRLMKEGRCFHCQERGHLARDCSTKASTSELKELEQKAPVNENDDDAGKV